MRRFSPAILMLALVTAANAGDVPLPEKKPRDAKGQPVTSFKPETAKAAGKAETTKAPAAATAAANSGRDGAHPVPGEAEGSNKAAGKPGDKAPQGSGAAWPKTLPEAKAEAEAKAKPESVPVSWSDAEIADAKAMCKTILEKIDAVAIAEAPIRQGECGAPAPMRLISIGRKPEVVLNPPAVMTCGMIGALHTWLNKDLQPLAKTHLGSEIIKIESMSDYSCRNAYGRTKTRLSEHGRANALDIRGFVTAKGESAMVLTGWGETDRDVAARALAAKQAEEKANAIRAAAEAAAAKGGAKGEDTAKAATPPAGSTGSVDKGSPKVRNTIVDGTPETGSGGSGLGLAPSHLGAPKDAVPEPPGRMKAFLRNAHAAACRIFGTTLGPEANNAHRNHFHVDMAPRERSKFCE